MSKTPKTKSKNVNRNDLDKNIEFKKPNGGYGWIILLSISLIHFILIGWMYSFGIILKDLQNHFQVPQGVANLLQSLNTGFLYASGPLSSALAKEFSCRTIIIISAFVFGSMIALCAILPSFYAMIFALGFIGGVGYGCTYLTGFIILVDYFDTKLGIANGIMMASAGFGAFAFAPLTNFLLKNFGWKYTMVIVGSLVASCGLIACLLRPIEYYKKKHQNENEELEDLNQNREIEPTKIETEKCILIRLLKEVNNFGLLKQEKMFLLIVISGFFVFFTYYVPFIYIPFRAQELGITNYPWIISTAGIANIPVRLLLGFLYDRKIMRAIYMNTICLFIAIICLFSYYFLTTFYLQLVFAVVFAIPMAGVHSLSTPYLVEIVGSTRFRNASGILNMSRGLGAMLGPFLAGVFSQSFGSILYPFLFSGASFTAAMILSAITSVIFLIKDRKSKHQNPKV